MLPVPYAWLWLIPFVPMAVAVLGFPLVDRVPRPVILALGFMAWLTSLGAAGTAFLEQLARGGFSRVAQAGFQGVRLMAERDGLVSLQLEGNPLSLLLSLTVGVAGLATLVGATRARGGGARREQRASTAASFLAQLLTLGCLQWAILERGLYAAGSALVVTSLLSAALLLSERPRERELDGALRLFTLHRIGDACVLLALSLTYAAFNSTEPTLLSAPPSVMVAGLDQDAIARVVVWLWLAAAASRLSPIGVPAFFRDATGAPTPTLSTLHGIAGFGLVGLIAIRTSPAWDEATCGLIAGVAAATCVYAAARAALAEHAVRVDLHILHTLAALSVLSFALGNVVAGVLGVVMTMAFAPALLLPTAAVIEALHGRTSLFDFGGLMKALRASDFARGLVAVSLAAFPLSPLFLLVEPVAFDAMFGPRRSPLIAAAVLTTAGLLGFASFRAFHLMFAGDKPRSPPPAVLVEVDWPRRITQVLLAFALLLLPALFATPPGLVRHWVPEYRGAFVFYLQPHLTELSHFAIDLDGLTRGGARVLVEPLARMQLAVGLAVLAALGYGLSRSLYRRRAASPPRATPRVASVLEAIESGLGLEGRLIRALAAALLVLAIAVRTLVFNFFLDGVLTRVTGGSTSVVRALSRLAHNGDVQRGLALILVAIGLVIYGWGA